MAASIFNGNYVKILKNRLKAQNDHLLPAWAKYSFDYLDVQTAATNNTIDIHELIAKEIVHQIIVDVTTGFQGGSITSVDMSIGPQTDLTKFVPGGDIYSAYAEPEFYVVDGLLSMSADVFCRLDFDSVGANLSALTQGVMDIYLLLSKVPEIAE